MTLPFFCFLILFHHTNFLSNFGCNIIITGYNFSWSTSTDLLSELSRREKEANIKPDPDIDVYMKVRKKLLSILTELKEAISMAMDVTYLHLICF